MKRNTVLTSTFSNVLLSSGTLTAQSLSKAHRKPLRGVACGVLVAIGISLLLVPEAGSSNMSNIKMTTKQYARFYLSPSLLEYKCLAQLYGKESAWNPEAINGSHYGIPQGNSIYLLTASPIEQVRWGMRYNQHRYGSMCGAWKHWVRYGWH